ncbi:hypothetical protein JW960_28540 [candidate division KSB1 bacterium]|nr:hypothetical protein [candidate division KSB1 bacterium]
MDSRERVFKTLSHQEPDRIPIDYWAANEVNATLLKHYGFSTRDELLDHFDVDFWYIDGPKYVGPKLGVRSDGSQEDHFGVPRKTVIYGDGPNTGEYKEVVDFPLANATSVDEIENYTKWPTAEWFDYECVRAQAREAMEKGKVVMFMGDRLNRCAQLKPAMYVRGVEQILIDTLMNPEIAETIIRRINEFYVEYCKRTLEAGEGNIDILFTGDDFGTQTNTFVSVDAWRQFLRDGFKRFIDIGHQFGCQVAHHTCGSVYPLIRDFIECGLDILNPLQPFVTNLDHAQVKREFGDQLCFHGGVSIQKTMPQGSRDDVLNEVQNLARNLAPDGGYIFCTAHNIQVDTPLQNIETLFRAYREFGIYH